MSEPTMEAIGRVEGFFAKPSVAVVALRAPLRVGDTVYIKGHTTDFQQVADSLQVDHQAVEAAAAGTTVGMNVRARCRKHDLVYRLAEGLHP